MKLCDNSGQSALHRLQLIDNYRPGASELQTGFYLTEVVLTPHLVKLW